ncbi:hypothetical protein ERIC1_1c32550 [Paenibacillus larvae subsp. larvae DSM 25719]|uniref:Uncharacterized protein n=1 Tax=Paenibacillus larvae subsp. larvae DSM 25430 TaxID=697284 RepID=V9WAV5_9BACL|nr:hypothetical protein ERIC2_c35710 [Paenibacillus larvae subsp. larvae DSM 25430]ETK29696.1 hypothetical protein ERIC1_1c32550 [Paenibacillus larvae subsp. larvae DSM 25719]
MPMLVFQVHIQLPCSENLPCSERVFCFSGSVISNHRAVAYNEVNEDQE